MREKRPKVKINRGQEINFNRGFKIKFNIAKTKAIKTYTYQPLFFASTPGKILSAKKIEKAKIAHFIKIFILTLPFPLKFEIWWKT